MCVCSSQYSELSPHLHPPICFRHDQWPCPCLHLERKALCSQTTRQRPLGRSNGPTKNVFILSICCKCLLYGQAAEVPLKCTSSVATNYETETTTLQNNANGNEHAGKKQRHTSERGHQTIFSKKIKKNVRRTFQETWKRSQFSLAPSNILKTQHRLSKRVLFCWLWQHEGESQTSEGYQFLANIFSEMASITGKPFFSDILLGITVGTHFGDSKNRVFYPKSSKFQSRSALFSKKKFKIRQLWARST